MADVLVITMKRLPLRLEDEKAEFDLNTDQYHVKPARDDKRSRAIQGGSDGALDGAATKVANDDDDENYGARPSSGKKKKKGKNST